MGAGRLLLIAKGLPEPSIHKPFDSAPFLLPKIRATSKARLKILSQAVVDGKEQ